MATPRQIAAGILAEDGQPREHRPPAWADLVMLARAYVSADSTGDDRRTLALEGPVYVSAAAAATYERDVEGIEGIEQARRELTELLLDARQHATDLTSWRARSRSTGLDVSARVAIEGRLLVVTHVSIREHKSGGRR